MSGRVTTSCTREMAALAKAVMALCRYLGFFVFSRAERQSRLKKRWGWEVIFPRANKGARWGEKVGTDFGSCAEAGLISGGEQMSLRLARRRWWRIRVGKGERQASLCKHVVLVVKKQLVIHLQTRRQKMDIGFMMAGGGSIPQTHTEESGPGASVLEKDRGGEGGPYPGGRGGG